MNSINQIELMGLSELSSTDSVSIDGGALPLIIVVAGGVSAKAVFTTCVAVAGAVAAFTYNALND